MAASTERAVLVCGSRGWTDAEAIRHALCRLRPDIVIEGGARGADQYARNEAQVLGIHVATVDARWDRLKRAAGPARNQAMLALKPDRVLAFWDGKSPGTRHMIDLARREGIPVEVVTPNPGETEGSAESSTPSGRATGCEGSHDR